MTTPRHILLVGNYPPDGEESMHRYASLLARHLPGLGFKITLLSPSVFFGRLSCGSKAMAKFLGYLDKLILFPSQLRRAVIRVARDQPVDLVHLCDNGNAFYVGPRPRAPGQPPCLVTCHDFFAMNGALGLQLEAQPRFTGRLLQRYTLRGLHRAEHLLCVSKATAEDLERLSPGARARSTTIYNGLDDNFPGSCPIDSDAVIRFLHPARHSHPGGYIFHVGHNHWYKNRKFILETYFEICRRLSSPPLLVLAGRKLDSALASQLSLAPANARVIDLGHVDDVQLAALYTNAACLFFPSLAEGFGWPILEAMACACPVITSAREPMTELAGDAAILIDPTDVAKAADATIKILLRSPEERIRIIDAGRRRAADFSTSRMIHEVGQLYRKLLGEPAPSNFVPAISRQPS
jgi:glycosyltransferase involved in cell wall biosynthesis